MGNMIAKNQNGIFADKNGVVMTDSLSVADFFGKKHFHVLRDIEQINLSKSGLTPEFCKDNFIKSNYTDRQGRKYPLYCLTRNGFMMLTMGYTGKKAMSIKQRYIEEFDKMREFVAALASTKDNFAALTDTIKQYKENAQHYDFSNEFEMINRIVIGKTARQFRAENGIDKGESIRPHLTRDQLEQLDKLQAADVELYKSVPDYRERKERLTAYYNEILRAV